MESGVRQVPEGSGELGKLEETGCEIICGAPTTLAVKGQILMMKMKFILYRTVTFKTSNHVYVHYINYEFKRMKTI